MTDTLMKVDIEKLFNEQLNLVQDPGEYFGEPLSLQLAIAADWTETELRHRVNSIFERRYGEHVEATNREHFS